MVILPDSLYYGRCDGRQAEHVLAEHDAVRVLDGFRGLDAAHAGASRRGAPALGTKVSTPFDWSLVRHPKSSVSMSMAPACW